MHSEGTVFVVDDDESVLDSLVVLLTSAGLKVIPYGSGLTFLRAYDPAIRGCLVLDIQMPDMNGLELQEKLTEKQATMPIIMITGHGDIKMAVKALKRGAFDFIEKPFTDDVIINCIYNALEFHEKARNKNENVIKINELVAQLTMREREVFIHLIRGDLNKVIAAKLEISTRTVEIHRAHIMEKLQVRSLSHLVKMAILAGLE
ncbi:MAG: response regulator transcription factor [Gammaproteobacteria bacterium]|nr:response regulator transcription factor [Gammaproteobacteria bacterium]